METVEEKIENIEGKIEKKVIFNEEENTEKVIEELVEDEDSNVINEKNEEENLVELEEKIIVTLMKSVEICVSRGVYKPEEIANVGKVIDEFNSQIKTEDNKLMISKFKKTTLNNFKILIEISISRGGYQVNELADIGDLYNYISTLV